MGVLLFYANSCDFFLRCFMIVAIHICELFFILSFALGPAPRLSESQKESPFEPSDFYPQHLGTLKSCGLPWSKVYP